MRLAEKRSLFCFLEGSSPSIVTALVWTTDTYLNLETIVRGKEWLSVKVLCLYNVNEQSFHTSIWEHCGGRVLQSSSIYSLGLHGPRKWMDSSLHLGFIVRHILWLYHNKNCKMAPSSYIVVLLDPRLAGICATSLGLLQSRPSHRVLTCRERHLRLLAHLTGGVAAWM